MNFTCPICASTEFEPTAQILNLADILSRWQATTGVAFSPALWREYTTLGAMVVTLYRCSRCSFAMFEPPITGSQEFYANITEKNYYVSEKWEFFEALRDIEEFHVQRVLDIGCGSGDFLGLLRTLNIDGIGYEFSPDVAELARSRGFTVYSGNFPDVILGDKGEEFFDAICIFQVLEHVAEPHQLITDARRLLRPGGLLIVAVPDADGPIRYFPDALTDIPPHHVSRWSESVFRIGMPSLDFTVKKVAFEPLPDYLWNTYLPVLWDNNIWPVQLCKSVDPDEKMARIDRILWFIDQMKTHGVKWLDGVPGHTLYVVLQLSQNDGVGNVAISSQPLSDPNKTQSQLDPTMVRLLSGTIRYIEDWARGQQVEHKVRIERREAILSQREAGLSQREESLNQREASLSQREVSLNQYETEHNSYLLVRIMRLINRLWHKYIRRS